MGLHCLLPTAGPGCSPWRLEVFVQVSAARSYIFLPISAGNRAAAGGEGWEALKAVPSFFIILFVYFLFISPIYYASLSGKKLRKCLL